MANKFTQAAKKVTGGSEVIAGLEKIENDLLIAAYPNGFTINGADLINSTDQDTGETKQFCVFTFAEDPSKYASGGKQLTEMVKEWFALTGAPDGMQLSAALRQEGGVKVKLEKVKTQSGRKFTKVTVLEG